MVVEVSMSKEPIELSPIDSMHRLQAVGELCYSYDLDDNWCAYCGSSLFAGDWQFVCSKCLDPVARGIYNLPACWIGEMFLELTGWTNEYAIKLTGKNVIAHPRGALRSF